MRYTSNQFREKQKKTKITAAVLTVLVLTGVGYVVFNKVTDDRFPDATPRIGDGVNTSTPSGRGLPPFIYSMRTAWTEPVYDDFQLDSLTDLGITYAQGLPSFFWAATESGPNGDFMKWGVTDGQMDKLSARGIKVIPFLQTPKLRGLHWDQSILRTDPRYAEEYGEYAYEVVSRYKNHPAWSGVVAVWGGSSDIWDRENNVNDPEIVVPLLNAVYDGIKRADPNTIVVGFNMGTDTMSEAEWIEWHERAFRLNPRFDWFGVQTHSVPVGTIPGNQYAGLMGIANIRRFLDTRGYGKKPMFLNEGGFHIFNSGYTEQSQAEQAVQTYVSSRALSESINLKGWVYFTLFGDGDSAKNCGESNDGDNWGIMTCLDLSNPLEKPQPRVAYRALKTLFSTINFSAYAYEATEKGAPNQTAPFVFRFAKSDNRSAKLWVVFSPRRFVKGGSEPVRQDVTINISPARQATRVDILGNQTTVRADGDGNVTVRSGSSPIFVR